MTDREKIRWFEGLKNLSRNVLQQVVWMVRCICKCAQSINSIQYSFMWLPVASHAIPVAAEMKKVSPSHSNRMSRICTGIPLLKLKKLMAPIDGAFRAPNPVLLASSFKLSRSVEEFYVSRSTTITCDCRASGPRHTPSFEGIATVFSVVYEFVPNHWHVIETHINFFVRSPPLASRNLTLCSSVDSAFPKRGYKRINGRIN